MPMLVIFDEKLMLNSRSSYDEARWNVICLIVLLNTFALIPASVSH